MFDKTKSYARKEIQELVGGEIQTYLPQKNKRILAGCFNRELNPDCPSQVQAGNAGKVTTKAELLISQPDNVFPVFIKPNESSRLYEYIGQYSCLGGTNEQSVLDQAESKSGRYGELSYVFDLQEVE